MEIAFTYDWLSATMDFERGHALLLSPIFGDRVDGSQAIPRHGYTRAAAWESGVVAMWNSEAERMGFHVVLSGSSLRWMWKKGTSPQYLLDGLHDLGARFSRIDLAIDLRGSLLTPVELSKKSLRPYKGRGRTPALTTVTGDDGSWTVYVGSRSSDKFLRIYDKAKEQGNYEADYVRIEGEFKGMVAHWLGDVLFETTQERAYGIASTLIRGMADFEAVAYQAALSGVTVDLALPKPTERKTLQWLVETAAPSLARVMREKPSENALEQFLKAVSTELGVSLGGLLTGSERVE